MARTNDPKQPRSSTRYSARVKLAGGKVQEIGIGTNLAVLISHAKKYHDQHGCDVWVWNVRTGATLFAIANAPVQKAGVR